MGAYHIYKECSIFKLSTCKSYRNIHCTQAFPDQNLEHYSRHHGCVSESVTWISHLLWYWSTSFSVFIVILSLTFNECGWQLLPYHAVVLLPYTTDDNQWPAPSSTNNKATRLLKKKKNPSVPFLTDHSSITYQWCYIINSTETD